MLEEKPKLEPGSVRVGAGSEHKQRRRMYLALVFLLAALLVILVKDRRFWFGASENAAADMDTGEETTANPRPATASPKAPIATTKAKTQKPAKGAADNTSEPPAIVASNRKVLPPLEVEVIAGDKRRTVRPGSSSVKVEIPSNAAPAPTEAAPTEGTTAASASTNAAERVRMSADTTHVVERSVEPSYPMLARQMKVQGSVVLRALIGTDGLIQDLQVQSGPAILASAAREAVRQWRFKPYLQNGQAVETEAKITVNFTISTF